MFRRFQQFPEDFRTFSEDFRRFSKIFENSPKAVRNSYEHFRSFFENLGRCTKISEDNRSLPNISELSLMMFQSYRNKFRFVQQLNLVNLLAHVTSLISSHISSHEKIS